MLKISKRQQMICNVVLSILGLVWLAPIIFVVLNIFKTKQEYNMGNFWQLPHSFAVVDNFKNVVANKLFVYMGSSLLYAVGRSCSGSILFSAGCIWFDSSENQT